jgi:CubicO group peptidase (beta-lactamase class C family)
MKVLYQLLAISFLLISLEVKSQELDSIFSIAGKRGFSGIVLYGKNGKIIYHKATGFRSFESKIPLLKTDISELASVSKQFTAMIIMICKEKGFLQYEDALEKYIDIPYKNITIRNLLQHTSGLPDYQDIMDKYWDKSKVAGNEDIIAYLNKYIVPVSFEPGLKYEYSNTGYVLLASIAEKLTGKSFTTLCKDWIFTPLQMKDTKIRANDEKNKEKRFAYGHLQDSLNNYINAKNFHSSDYTIWLGNRRGPGRISSTAPDLFKWDQGLYTNKIISQSALKEAFTSGTNKQGDVINYGFGWDISTNKKGEQIVSHTGSNPGYATIIIRNLTTKEVFVMLNNNDHPAAGLLTELFLK